jgi:peptide/nickel transport system substrate-binding protein
MDDIFLRMQRETDYDKRYQIVTEWQEAVFDWVPYVKIMYFSEFHLGHKSLKGYQNFQRYILFNCWIEE